jgi:hypothetical protein
MRRFVVHSRSGRYGEHANRRSVPPPASRRVVGVPSGILAVGNAEATPFGLEAGEVGIVRGLDFVADG